MKATKGWLAIVDDFGEKRYRVTKIEDGCYYFAEKTLADGSRLRYNEKEGRIEEYKEANGYWDVYDQYIYQVDFIKNI